MARMASGSREEFTERSWGEVTHSTSGPKRIRLVMSRVTRGC